MRYFPEHVTETIIEQDRRTFAEVITFVGASAHEF